MREWAKKCAMQQCWRRPQWRVGRKMQSGVSLHPQKIVLQMKVNFSGGLQCRPMHRAASLHRMDTDPGALREYTKMDLSTLSRAGRVTSSLANRPR